MRLIDADQLIKDGWHLERSGRSNRTLGVMSIADVPTAYDLEGKLQRLEAKIKEINDFNSITYEADIFVDTCREALLEAIEIVKGGEADETN